MIAVYVIVGVLLASILVFWVYGERGRLLRSSTWRVMRAGGLRRVLNFASLHGWLYGRWPNQYIRIMTQDIIPRLGQRGKRFVADRYHGKVLTPELAEAFLTIDVNREIPLQDLEQIIPYATARDLVLEGPPDVALFECACRSFRSQPCQPTQVCMISGSLFVDFTLEHHPDTTRRVSQSEALEVLREEHARGHLHSAWFKDALVDRMYAICNCCKCCCGGIEAMTKHGAPWLASSGYVARVDDALCNGCDVCTATCPFDALSLADATVAVDWEKCMGCGVCISQCPTEAMSLVRDEAKGVPLDVRPLVRDKVGAGSR